MTWYRHSSTQWDSHEDNLHSRNVFYNLYNPSSTLIVEIFFNPTSADVIQDDWCLLINHIQLHSSPKNNSWK
ncbi:unnamed protein product, partial [Nesidiocoris tenuis]